MKSKYIHKMINGVNVDLTPTEIAELEARDAAWAADANVRELRGIREQRDILLASTDWTMVNDAPLDSAQKEAWIHYRQSLRDITKQPDLNNVIWPTKPS